MASSKFKQYARPSLGLALVVGLGWGVLFCGCKGSKEPKIGAPGPAVEAAQKLPDGTNVLAALDQKDYAGAVSGLAKIQQTASEGELAPAFLTLKLYVKNRLIELAPTDPKAAEALNAIRLMTQGR
jgi:hypothetical protein